MTELQRFRSRPQVVEAVQWTGSDESLGQLVTVFLGKVRLRETLQLYAGKDGVQGWIPVPSGHWVVRNPGDNSDVWPVDPEHFANKHELVEDD